MDNLSNAERSEARETFPPSTPVEAAVFYAVTEGLVTFPAQIVELANGKKTAKSYKSKKYSNGVNWGATNDPEQIREDFRKFPKAQNGIPTGKENGLFVVEADTLEGHDIDGIASLAALIEKHGPLPETRTARSPSGSMHYYFRYPPGIKIKSSDSEIAPGVDVKGEGGMVLAPPSARPKGKYEWINWGPIADAPEWLIELCRKKEVRKPKPDNDYQAGDSPKAKSFEEFEAVSAMAVIPNVVDGDKGNWFEWNNTLMALWAATGGSAAGRAAAHLWSAKAGEIYDRENTDERWDHYFTSPPDRTGAEKLFSLARQADPSWRDKLHDWLAARVFGVKGKRDQRTDKSFPEFYHNDNNLSDTDDHNLGHGSTDQRGNDPLNRSGKALSATEWIARDLPQPDFICGDWLTTTSRTILYAPTGIGKTMVGMGLASAMAATRPFLHWKARRPVRVLYIDGEMSRTLLKERVAEEAKRLAVVPDNLFVLSHEDVENFKPLNTREGRAAIEKEITRIGRIELVIFDNIMSLTTGDMKDTESWSQVMPWIKSLTTRRIASIWIHHTGHDESRSYGDKTKEWQINNLIRLERLERNDTDVSFMLKFEKARERNPKNRHDFEDVRVALVNDAWTWSSTHGVTQKKPSDTERKFYDVLVQVCDRFIYGHKGTTLEKWKDACIARGLLDPQKPTSSQRTKFHNYKVGLITKNWIATRMKYGGWLRMRGRIHFDALNLQWTSAVVVVQYIAAQYKRR